MKNIVLSMDQKSLTLEDDYAVNLPSNFFSDYEVIEKIHLILPKCLQFEATSFTNLSSLRELYIEVRQMREISDDVFSHLNNIEVLNFRANALVILPKNLFSSLKRLKKLTLQLDNIQIFFNDVLLHNDHLHELYLYTKLHKIYSNFFLSSKHIKVIVIKSVKDIRYNMLFENENFSKFPKLKSIIMEKVICLGFNFHSNIEKITLRKCYIENLLFLHNLSNLTYLDLTSCYLNVKFIDFRNHLLLKQLILDSNFVNSLKRNSFMFHKQLRYLSLNKCAISVIEEFFISELKTNHIEILKLASNHLHELNSSFFKNCNNLFHLNLNLNFITSLKNNCFQYLSNLEFLSLRYNNMRLIHKGVFKNLKFLKYLDLSSNKLENIDSEWFDLHTNNYCLVNLDLSSNHLCQLPDNCFIMLRNLMHLNLAKNSLNYLQLNCFKNLYILKDLNLSFNNIRSLKYNDFKDLKNLENLNLGYNKILNISNGVFRNLKKLKVLDLSFNSLLNITSCLFDSNQYLKILFLNNNFLESISKKLFHSLYELEVLKIDKNNLGNLSSDYFKNNQKLNSLIVNKI